MAENDIKLLFAISDKNFTNDSMRNHTNLTNAEDQNYVYHSPVVIGLSVAIGILGIFSNGLALIVLTSSKSMRKRISCNLIFNQSLADLASSVALVAYSTIQTTMVPPTLEGLILCELWLSGGIFWGFLLVSTWNLMALTIERYLSIVYPVWHTNNISHKRVRIGIIFIWVLPITQALIEAIVTTKVVDGQCKPFSVWTSEAARKVYGVFVLICYNIMPLACFIICYTKMALVIRAKARKMTPSATSESIGTVPSSNNQNNRAIIVRHSVISNNNASRTKNQKTNHWASAKRNILITLIWVSVIYIVCWTPQGIYFFIANMMNKTDFVSDFQNISTSLIYLNCCINPFVYLAKYRQFQVSAKKLFCSRSGSDLNTSDVVGKGGSNERES